VKNRIYLDAVRELPDAGVRFQAFSIIEVVIALGLASVAIVAICALLPIGIQSARDSINETAAINMLSQIVAERKAIANAETSRGYQIPPVTTATTGFLGLTDDGHSCGNNLQNARYRLDYVFTAPSTRLGPYQGYFRVGWPASCPAEYVEVTVSFPQP